MNGADILVFAILMFCMGGLVGAIELQRRSDRAQRSELARLKDELNRRHQHDDADADFWSRR